MAFLLSCHLVWHSLILAAQTRIRGMFVQEETLTNAGFLVTHMFDSIWPCSVSPCAIPALFKAAQDICLMAMAQNISKPLGPSSWTGKSTEQLRDHRHFFEPYDCTYSPNQNAKPPVTEAGQRNQVERAEAGIFFSPWLWIHWKAELFRLIT